jgi:simple sugar transport system permease protein
VSIALLLSVLTAAVVTGTTFLLASLGALLNERAGILNLGVEGMMLMGAVTGFVVDIETGSVAAGLAAACAAGGGMALLHALMTVSLRVNQIVMGLTLTILGTGLSAYIGKNYAGQAVKATLNPEPIPGLRSIPELGKIFFSHDVLVYAVPALTVALWWGLARPRGGLWLRAAGEQPAAADAAGVPVFAVRYLAVVAGGLLAGLAGAYFSLVYSRAWAESLTAGRGWIAIALVIFGRWNPLLVLGGAFLFGFTDALQIRVQAVSGGITSTVPTEIFAALPYVVTLIVMVAATVWAGRDAQPSALGVPFRKGVSA